MVDASLLSGLANPQVADVVGSLQRGQERGKRQQVQEMTGAILGGTLPGKLGELAQVDPQVALNTAQALGFTNDPQERMKHFAGMVQVAATIAEGAGPKEATAFLMEARDREQQLYGEGSTSMLDGMIVSLNENPNQGIEALGLMRDSLLEQGFIESPAGEEKFSATTFQLADGRIVQTTNSGRILVNGEVVTPDEQAKIIKEANEEGIRIQSARQSGRSQASAAVDRSEEAFDSLETVRGNILNLDEGIRLLDEGAGTGPVLSLLPSVRKASVELDNLQGRLGLDVLQSTTFGALSAAELAFALDTALPQKLPPADLRKWMVRKKDAQVKLARYLTEAAIFLGTEGNTTVDFIQAQRLKQLERDEPQEEQATPNSVGRFSIEVVE